MEGGKLSKSERRAQKEAYMRQKVKPIFKQIFVHCLNERPYDPVNFMIEFLEKNKGNLAILG